MYGVGGNEKLIGGVLKNRRADVVVATRFGYVRTADGGFAGISGRPDHVRQACDASLQRLNLDVIDLYYQHRVDPGVPIEETVGAMGELVKAGKVRYLGLSEAAPETIRRAHATHPISVPQTEYSLWSRQPEHAILPTLRELGIGFVPYSPLGRGMSSGVFRAATAIAADDFRRSIPRFQGEQFARNLAQLSLAWLLAQGDDIVPIPGTKRRAYLAENLGALQVTLSAAGIQDIESFMHAGAVSGERYDPSQMAGADL